MVLNQHCTYWISSFVWYTHFRCYSSSTVESTSEGSRVGVGNSFLWEQSYAYTLDRKLWNWKQIEESIEGYRKHLTLEKCSILCKWQAKNSRQAASHCEVNVVTSVMSISKSAYFPGLVYKSYYLHIFCSDFKWTFMHFHSH